MAKIGYARIVNKISNVVNYNNIRNCAFGPAKVSINDFCRSRKQHFVMSFTVPTATESQVCPWHSPARRD